MFTKIRHQAAGHEGAMTDESESLFIKPTSQQEIDFYTQVHEIGVEELQKQGKDREGDRLVDYLPVFMGTLESGITAQVEQTAEVSEEMRKLDLNSAKEDKPYLVLQNLLKGFKSPSIIDIKLGALLHDENTPEEKRKRLQKVSETTTSGSLHYRVCGMKLYHTDIPDLSKFPESMNDHVTKDDDFLVFNKFYGRALTPETVIENFKIYFHHNKLNKDQQELLVQNFYTRLQLLYNCLLSYEVRIRSGSLLFVYENDPTRWMEQNNQDPLFREEIINDEDEDDDDDEDDQTNAAPLSSVTLIDFAHSKFTPGKGPDENIIQGVENILDALDKLL